MSRESFVKLVVFLIILIYSMRVEGALEINKVIMRVPKENDYGLIFDLTVNNLETCEVKEILQYQIRSDGTCTLNLSSTERMCDASRIVGGDFGYIKPGDIETVSLIWPTVSLYNRVGFCPFAIITMNEKNEEKKIMQNLYFDTRFETLDPDQRTLRKMKNFQDCNNYDKDYFKNCTPVDCEERYFGRRSYYNFTVESCQEVPHCSGQNVYYDYFANECIDSMNFITDQDIATIKAGQCDNNYLELKPWYYRLPDYSYAVEDMDKMKRACNKSHAKPATFLNFGDIPYWAKGLLSGLLIVVATITIYILICFCIFLIASWISRDKCKNTAPPAPCQKPRNQKHQCPHDARITRSTASLMSRR